jgi:aspartate dehydrogenase
VAEADKPGPRGIALIGFGAMGRHVYRQLADDARLVVAYVVVPAGQVAALRAELRSGPRDAPRVVGSVDEIQAPPEFALECAGHTAVTDAVPRLLRRGVDVIIASVGALSGRGVAELLADAARQGGAQLTLVPGAVAGIDALAAARLQGLESVVYTGRKPPSGWLGTPAAEHVNLAALTSATVVFEGTAREAAARFPKNANVAAMVGLAGIGLDETRVTLIADPAVTRNTHTVAARGAFGELDIRTAGATLPENPKTSMLAALSIVRAVRQRVDALVI